MLFAPAGTPKPIVDKLHAEMNKIMADPEVKQKIVTIGLLPIDPPSIPDTVKYLAAEREKWGSLVKQLGLEGSQ
jgi:tripartite-type tricarboxylate transporter receptor subunit TctC